MMGIAFAIGYQEKEVIFSITRASDVNKDVSPCHGAKKNITEEVIKVPNSELFRTLYKGKIAIETNTQLHVRIKRVEWIVEIITLADLLNIIEVEGRILVDCFALTIYDLET